MRISESNNSVSKVSLFVSKYKKRKNEISFITKTSTRRDKIGLNWQNN